MAKSPDAFRTISEVSEWLDTPAHVLRFWESKFTQIKPVKRAGGRRYYRPEDMALLGGIKTLLHEQGMTIKGVQKLLREQGVRHVAAMGPQPLDAVGGYDEDMLEEEEAPARDVPPMRIIPAAPLPEVPARVTHAAAEPPAPPRPAADPVPESGPESDPESGPESAPEPEPDFEPDFGPMPRFGFAPPAPSERATWLAPSLAPSRAPSPAPAPAQPPAPPPRVRRSLPDLPPDPVATPGLLSAILSRDPATLSGRGARLAPVAARLATLRDRLRATI